MMPEPQTISIALCTFNGEAFLPRQLQSLLEQTRRPDELIVCDDGSTDRTIEIVEQFAAASPFPVGLTRNPSRLGPAQNFAQAIGQCAGQLIFLCDQDDLWQPEKIATMQAVFAADAQLAFAFSDAQMCDDAGRSLGYRLWSSIFFYPSLQRLFADGNGFDSLVRYNVVTGATLAFRAAYLPLVLPIDSGWMHDGWIALLLSAVGRGKAIDQRLIKYRQHAGQSVGASRRSMYQQYLNAKLMDRNVFTHGADAFEAVLARLQEQTDYPLHPGVVEKLQAKIQHYRRRSAIRLGSASRLSAVSDFLTGRYQQFSLGWKSFAQDLLL
jgi:glycosyltransferase involved in cell wall biosynthesis